MKRFLSIATSAVLTFILFIAAAPPAQAKMMYYTYSGFYVDSRISHTPSGGTATSPELDAALAQVGELASYTFGIDWDYIFQEMNTLYTDFYRTESNEYFKYVGGTALTGHSWAPQFLFYHPTRYFISDAVLTGPDTTFDTMRNMAHFCIFNPELSLEGEWFSFPAGVQSQLNELLYFNLGSEEVTLYLDVEVSLTSISETNPYATPLPPTALLLGTGLACLAGWTRRWRGWGKQFFNAARKQARNLFATRAATALSLLLFSLFLVSFTTSSAEARMWYLTYEGTYTNETVNPPAPWQVEEYGATVPDEIFRLGETARYTFAVDFSLPAIQVYPDYTGYLPYGKYADYAGGTVVLGYPAFIFENDPDRYSITPGGSTDSIEIFTHQYTLSSYDFVITFGSFCTIHEAYQGRSNDYDYYELWSAYLSATVQLVSISDTNPYAVSPTPIPGAVWLLGTGVLGLIGLRKRFRS